MYLDKGGAGQVIDWWHTHNLRYLLNQSNFPAYFIFYQKSYLNYTIELPYNILYITSKLPIIVIRSTRDAPYKGPNRGRTGSGPSIIVRVVLRARATPKPQGPKVKNAWPATRIAPIRAFIGYVSGSYYTSLVT